MLTPRYYFADDFCGFHDYFLAQPHKETVFRKGELLWKPGQPYDRLNYFLSGAAVHFAEHETGRRRIISFHGPGTVFPGYHTTDFRIELSLTMSALSKIRVLEFTIPQFRAMFESNAALAEQVVNWYAMYVNRFLFETVHREFNSSRVKLCNLLYLLTMNQPANSGLVIEMTQEDLADILGISRVHLTRELTELRRMGVLTPTGGATRLWRSIPSWSPMTGTERHWSPSTSAPAAALEEAFPGWRRAPLEPQSWMVSPLPSAPLGTHRAK